jgi:hypothetical protein
MTATIASTKLRFLPLPSAIADEARRTMTDRFGHKLHITKTQAPCRVCLKISKVPEDLILLSYQPLDDTGPYAEIGPIFIHAIPCEPYANVHALPPDFAMRPLVLRSYNAAGEIVDSLVAPPGTAEQWANHLFEDGTAVEVHARHISHTCFDFKILRDCAV